MLNKTSTDGGVDVEKSRIENLSQVHYSTPALTAGTTNDVSNHRSYQAEHLRSIFGSEDVWHRLASNPATREYLQDPAFSKLIKRLAVHPDEVYKYICDPRFQAILAALTADVGIVVGFDDMTASNTIDLATAVGAEDEEISAIEMSFQDFETAKSRGNELFKANNDIQGTIRCYKRALQLIHDGVDSSVASQRAATIHCNLAAVFLRLERYTEAEGACDNALSLVNGHVKALFRRSQARLSLGRLEHARDDLLAAERFIESAVSDYSKNEANIVRKHRLNIDKRLSERSTWNHEVKASEEQEWADFESKLHTVESEKNQSQWSSKKYSEKDWSHWLLSRIKKRILAVEVFSPGALIKMFEGYDTAGAPKSLQSTDSYSGTATLWSRNGKAGCNYDIDLRLPWRGVLLRTDTTNGKKSEKVEGVIYVKNVTSDVDESHWLLSVEREKHDPRWKDGEAQQRLEKLAMGVLSNIKWCIKETLDELELKKKNM